MHTLEGFTHICDPVLNNKWKMSVIKSFGTWLAAFETGVVSNDLTQENGRAFDGI